MFKISNMYKRVTWWGGFALVAALMLVGVGLAPSTASAAGDPAAGQMIYNARCVFCHGAQGQGGVGPNIQCKTRARLDEIIMTGATMQSQAGLLPQERDDVVAFLATLGNCGITTTTQAPTTTTTQATTTTTQASTTTTQATTTTTLPTTTTTTTNGGGNAAAGQALFTSSCQSCHGATGAGSPPVFPCVKGKTLADLNNAIATGGTMPFVAGNLTAQQKADVIAYLATLGTCNGATTTTTGATTTTTQATTTTTTQPSAGFPANCGVCHAIPTNGGIPNACSPTFTATKRQTMSGFTGGAVTVAQIDAAVAAICGGGTTTTTQATTTTTQATTTTTTQAGCANGEALAKQYCGMCHGLNVNGVQIAGAGGYSITGRDKATWVSTVNRMISNGCPVGASNVDCVATYLAGVTSGGSTTTTTGGTGTTTTTRPSTGGGVMFSLFGWTDSRKQHRDYVERIGPCIAANGKPACNTCHSITRGVASPNPAAPSCYTCHDRKWSTSNCGTTTSTTRPSGGGVMFQLFGWTDTRKQHRDYVERIGPCTSANGKPACNTCHSITRGVASPNPAAPSCYTCHDRKWSTSNCGTTTSTTRPSGGGVMFQLFGWTDTRKQHRDYAERNGVTQCISCHSVWRGVPSPNPAAPSCYTCHDRKWDSTPPAPTTTTTGATTTTTTSGGGGTTTTTTAPAIDGAALYSANCQACHGANGTGGFAPKLSNRGGVVTGAFIQSKIDTVALMASLMGKFNAAQLDAIAAYLATQP